MLFLYNLLSMLILPFWPLFLLYRASKGKEQLSRIGERFGFASQSTPQDRKILWIHAASVGEALSVILLIKTLRTKLPAYQILLTSGTITSAAIIKDHLKTDIIHQFLPLDNYFCINKFLNHWQPRLALFVESEFWPCILTQTAKRCQVISVNTRISERSFKKWQRYPNAAKEVLGNFCLFLPQSLNDQARLQALGFSNHSYLGNLKYCTDSQFIDLALKSKLQDLFKGRTLLLAASTHPGEDEIIANIFRTLQPKSKNLLLIIAPRHPVRGATIRQMLVDNYGFNVATRSAQQNVTTKTDVYLADTLGELNYFYSIASISLVGGSFKPYGGHNPIEPARFNSAIITGRYYDNFKEIYDEFLESNAAYCCKDEQDCVNFISKLFAQPKLGQQYGNNAQLLINHKDKTLDLVIESIMQQAASTGSAHGSHASNETNVRHKHDQSHTPLSTPRFWQKNGLLPLLLTPFSWIYLLGHRINQSRQTPKKFNKKLICIGNIIAGGAGKTPAAIAIGKLLQHHKHKIAFASKNYIGNYQHPKEINLSADKADLVSDEPLLLAKHASSFVAKDRVDAVRLACTSAAEIILLDDGLQNRNIAADINILVVDSIVKFGNKKLLPAGPLREPLNSIAQADLILQIGGDKNSITELAPYQDKLFILNQAYTTDFDHQQKYLAFTGIAYPSKFFTALKQLGLNITQQISFPDHYLYQDSDLVRLDQLAMQHSSQLITTEKDLVRIDANWQKNLYTLKMELQFVDQADFYKALIKLL